MNTSSTIKAIDINSPFRQHVKQHAATSALLTAVLLTFFSINVLAVDFRPAMAGSAEAENNIETQPDSLPESHPEEQDDTAAPSAVELMMQHQSQQAGHSTQLPATEIQPGETIKIELLDEPRRGMSMDKVQQLFGQPLATSGGVGNPPISNWTYGDRIVYFEYSTVIHVVAR
ncbi:MAG: hypothetical protein RQ982_09010 [Gammaproteobacteria bacterium]|nr:hypothetical protein [Gammaproteobacteria bacterium]